MRFFERLLTCVDALPFELELALRKPGLGPLELVGQFGAVDLGDNLPCDNLFTGVDIESDRARSRCIQRRADRRDDTALYRHIADEVAAYHGRGADALEGHADRRVGPTLHRWRCGYAEDDQGNDNAGNKQPFTPRVARSKLYILR